MPIIEGLDVSQETLDNIPPSPKGEVDALPSSPEVDVANAWRKVAINYQAEEIANAKRLSQTTGQAAEALLRNSANAKLLQHPYPDFGRLAQESPETFRVVQDPIALGENRDVLPHLGVFERTVELFRQEYKSMTRVNQADRAIAQRLLVGDVSGAADLAKNFRQGEGEIPAESVWDRFVAGTARVLPYMGETLSGGAAGGLGGMGLGFMVGGPPGAIAGATVGMAAGAAEMGRQLMNASAFREYIQEGMDPETAGLAAAAVGVVNAGIEALQASQLLAPFVKLLPGGSKLLSGLEVRSLVKSLVTDGRLAQFMKGVGVGIPTQVAEEVLQDIVQRVGGRLGGLPEDPDLLAGLAETVKESFFGLAPIVVAGAGVGTMRGRGGKVRTREADVAKLNKGIEEAIAAEVQPEYLGKIIAGVAEKNPEIETLYVPAEAIDKLYQATPDADPAGLQEFLAKIGVTPKQYQEALDLGLDLMVPTAKLPEIHASEQFKGLAAEVALAPREPDIEALAANLSRLAVPTPTQEMEKVKQDVMAAGRPEEEADIAASLLGARSRVWAYSNQKMPSEWPLWRQIEFQGPRSDVAGGPGLAVASPAKSPLASPTPAPGAISEPKVEAAAPEPAENQPSTIQPEVVADEGQAQTQAEGQVAPQGAGQPAPAMTAPTPPVTPKVTEPAQAEATAPAQVPAEARPARAPEPTPQPATKTEPPAAAAQTPEKSPAPSSQGISPAEAAGLVDDYARALASPPMQLVRALDEIKKTNGLQEFAPLEWGEALRRFDLTPAGVGTAYPGLLGKIAGNEALLVPAPKTVTIFQEAAFYPGFDQSLGELFDVRPGAGFEIVAPAIIEREAGLWKLRKKGQITYRVGGETLYQPARGSVSFKDDGRIVVEFLEQANLTTAPHEIFHIFRRDLEMSAFTDGAPALVRADWEATNRFVGATSGEAWTGKQEEKFANAGVAYLMDGKSPSPELDSVFARMARWFAEVYRVLRGRKGIKISDEMRGVFDRLLVVQEAATLAEAEIEMSADPAAMPDAGAYQAQYAAAREAAVKNVMAHRQKEYRRELAAWRKEGREMGRAHQGQRLMRAVVARGGINAESLSAHLTPETMKALGKKRVGLVVKTGGLDIEGMAAASGQDVAALVETMLNAPSVADAMETYVAQKTMEHDATLDPLEMAITDEYLKLMKMEAEALVGEAALPGRRGGVKVIIKESLHEIPADELSKENYQNLLASFRAQSRAAKEGFRAGKKEEAANAKAKAIALAEKIKTRAEAKREIAKAKSLIKKVMAMDPGNPETGRGVEWDFLVHAKQLVGLYPKRYERFGPYPPVDASGFVAWLQAKAKDPAYEHDLLDTMPNPPSQLRTVGDWVTLSEIITALAYIGETANKVEAGLRKLERAGQAAEIVKQSTDGRAPGTPLVWEEARDSKAGKAGTLFRLIKPQFILRRLDHWKDDGPARKYLWRRMADARDVEDSMGAVYRDKLQALMDILSPEDRAALSQRAKVQGVTPMLTLEERLCIALNSGNAGNLRTLLENSAYGWEWLQQPGQHAAVLDSLDERHWKFVTETWAMLDTLFPALDKVHFDMTGVHLVKVEPAAIQTRFGEIQGGYFPIVADYQFDKEVAKRVSDQDLMADKTATVYTQNSTRAGATYARTGSKKAPILSLGLINRHLRDVIHDIAFRRAIRDTQKIITDPAFIGMFEKTTDRGEYFSKGYHDELLRWVKETAHPPEYLRDMQISNIFNYIRNTTYLTALGLKITTMGVQLSALSQTQAELKGGWTAGSMARFCAHPEETWEAAVKNSTVLQNRNRAWDRDAANITNIESSMAGKVARYQKGAATFAMWGMKQLDMVAAVISWDAAYRKALEGTWAGNPVEAAKSADDVVRTSQGSTNPEDLASLFRDRNEMIKFVTMFQSFFNTFTNRAVEVGWRVKEGEMGAWTAAGQAFWLVVVPVAMSQAIYRRGVPDEPKELAEFGLDMVSYAMNGLPLVGSLFNYIIGKMTGRMGGGAFRVSAMEGTLQDLADMMTGISDAAVRSAQDKKVNWPKTIKSTIMGLGATGLLPGARQVASTTYSAMKLAEGDRDYSWLDLLVPLTTQERKERAKQ